MTACANPNCQDEADLPSAYCSAECATSVAWDRMFESVLPKARPAPCHGELVHRRECACCPPSEVGWYALVYAGPSQTAYTRTGPHPDYQSALGSLKAQLPPDAIVARSGGGEVHRFEIQL